MIVKVYGYTLGDDQAAHYDSFEIPYCEEDEATVMDVLDYISVHLDHTLSYYKHSACNHGICGRCLVKVNGENKLACITKVKGEQLLLEPVNKEKVMKDLIIG